MKASALPITARSYVSDHPSYVILFVTSRCNQGCTFCFYHDSLNADTGELSLEEITKVARSVWPCAHWTLTGGEPFLRKDLLQVVSSIIENGGARNVTIPTNGTYTKRVKTVMGRLAERFPATEFRIVLSIDDLGPRHDAIRVMPGAFERAMATRHAVRELQADLDNLHLFINATVSKLNKERMHEFIDYYFERMPCDDLTLALARGDTKEPSATDVSGEEYVEFVRYLEMRKAEHETSRGFHKGVLRFIEKETRAIVARTATEKRFQLPCVAGRKLVVLYDTGVLAPCEIIETLDWPEEVRERFGGSFEFGNVRDFDCDVRAMLDTDRGRAIQRFVVDSKCFCTFECAIAASMVFNPRALLKALVSPPSREVRT